MSKPMPRCAFFGTPQFAVHALKALEAQGLSPALVVTAPERPAGRGLNLQPSPAKVWAEEREIDVLEPLSLRDKSFVAELGNTDWDVFVVSAYAKLIPKNILDIPRKGSLNLHPSLLPKFRGPSPAVSAILADERATGVSVMLMTEKMDAGPVLAQARIELEEGADGWPPTGSFLEELLATEGGNLLAEILPEWLAGTLTPEPQDESKATYTHKFKDQDALVDLMGDARQNLLKIRAFDQGPRAHFFTKDGKRVLITDARISDSTLEILKVIPEGKREMSYEVFAKREATQK
ncbi:methionyl-tRNA formyltransferase [Patescibacteria group bacterium]|nr:methionyl-tRNA formyltransferase [Patescibacteria group bacterium]